jgi:hypothetical protein
MATDVRLDAGDGTHVVVDAATLKVAGADFVLDSLPRRKNNSPLRRALVHDQNDGLTINFDEDYPGGVTVGGALLVRGGISFETQELGHTAQIPPPGQGSGEVLIRKQVDLQQVLADLRARVERLEARP